MSRRLIVFPILLADNMMKIFKMFDFFGIEPQECLYVGDSEVDLEVCRACGIPLIAYKNKALRAPIHVESLAELKDILLEF